MSNSPIVTHARTETVDGNEAAARVAYALSETIAIGANDIQTVRAFRGAEAWPGPSLIIAYSTCIAHGIDMSRSMTHQKDAVRAGYWPLYRYRPGGDEHTHPFQLDSKDPSIPLAQFTAAEGRFSMLARANPAHAAELLALAQADVDERGRFYRQLAGIERSVPPAGQWRGAHRSTADLGVPMADLSTRYLGLDLANPLIASAGPLTGNLDMLRRLAGAGAAAGVLPSLFEEEIRHAIREQEQFFAIGADSSAKANSHLPEVDVDPGGVDRHLRLVEDAKAAVDVPVLASLNGSSHGGWTWYALALAEAVADGRVGTSLAALGGIHTPADAWPCGPG